MSKQEIQPFAILGRFVHLVKMWQRIEKQPRFFGLDEPLHSSEIHMIEVIGEQRDLSVSDLARQLGITKGAVSQTIKKIEKKGMIVKDADPDNASRALVSLTAKGKLAYYAHAHWHEKMDGGFRDYFTSLPQDKLAFLDEFLTQVEKFFQKRI